MVESVTLPAELPAHQQQPAAPAAPAAPGVPVAPAGGEAAPSVESLVKALADTKAELTRLQQAAARPPVEPTPPPADPAGTPPAAPANPLAVPPTPSSPPGLSLIDSLQSEIMSGQVSPETSSKVVDLLKPIFGEEAAKALVDQQTQVAMATSALYEKSVKDTAGGDAAYSAMINWMSESLSEGEINFFNEAVTSRDQTRALAAVRGAYAQFQLANPTVPRLINGAPSPASAAVAGFGTQREMVNAQKDPRYDKDPAYRAEVERRIAVSQFA